MKIVFRIVSALLALCVIPAAYFINLFTYRINAVIRTIGDDVSVHKIVHDFFGEGGYLKGVFNGSGSDFLSNPSVKRLMPAAICFLAFFALALIISLVIFFFAVFSRKRLVITCLGGGGLLSVIAAKISFHMLAAPLLSGEITLNSFINSSKLSSIIGMILKFGVSMVKFQTLKLTSAPVIMIVIFAAIVIWGLANILTDDDLGKKPVKKVKKAKEATPA